MEQKEKVLALLAEIKRLKQLLYEIRDLADGAILDGNDQAEALAQISTGARHADLHS